MSQNVIVDEIRFHAEMVAAEEEYAPDYIVQGIYFGEGDPEQDGQHWNFTRSLDDEDDDGVCVVREIQQVVHYGGIVKCTLSRQSLDCWFDEKAARETQTRRLFITFEIDDELWKSLVSQARLVFDGESYFEIFS